MSTITSNSVGAAAYRRQLVAMLQDLVQRVRSGRSIRADCTTDDVILALVAARGLAAMGASSREAAARRFATLILDALRAEP
ncbi:hypothetical protein [Curtobacterium sp. NPDC089185]|uniref:hypothetical protein n=1 Tax=Curtobacterium sp. NPDC089185 TaxID=3154968 RepID=UPI0034279C39